MLKLRLRFNLDKKNRNKINWNDSYLFHKLADN